MMPGRRKQLDESIRQVRDTYLGEGLLYEDKLEKILTRRYIKSIAENLAELVDRMEKQKHDCLSCRYEDTDWDEDPCEECDGRGDRWEAKDE